jgi:hypothetical protein
LNRQDGHIGFAKIGAMDGGNQFRFAVAMGRQHPTTKEQHHHYRTDNPEHLWDFPDHHFYLGFYHLFVKNQRLFSGEIMVGDIDPDFT